MSTKQELLHRVKKFHKKSCKPLKRKADYEKFLISKEIIKSGDKYKVAELKTLYKSYKEGKCLKMGVMRKMPKAEIKAFLEKYRPSKKVIFVTPKVKSMPRLETPRRDERKLILKGIKESKEANRKIVKILYKPIPSFVSYQKKNKLNRRGKLKKKSLSFIKDDRYFKNHKHKKHLINIKDPKLNIKYKMVEKEGVRGKKIVAYLNKKQKTFPFKTWDDYVKAVYDAKVWIIQEARKLGVAAGLN